MQTFTHDIIINGAGPTGSALALMLANKTRSPERIALKGQFLVSNNGLSQSIPNTPDPRTLALNHGSQTLLESLGAWPDNSASINTVHVSQRGRLGRTIIDCTSLNTPRLGSVVSYDDLLKTLHAKLHSAGIDLINSDEPSDPIKAKATVVSHGGTPTGVHRQYNQSAVLTIVKVSLPKPAWAYERFTRQGPLALLPHPQGSEYLAMVWCCPPEQAKHLSQISNPEFNRALQQHFGDRLGKIECVSKRHVFPLALYAGPQLLNSTTVAIGNAAQTLHPVAGQGLNLGLRDVAQLGIVLAPWLAQPESDVRPFLQAYTSNRRNDRNITMAVTDTLPRIFSTGNPLIEHGCGLALLTLDLLPAARNALSMHLLQGARS